MYYICSREPLVHAGFPNKGLSRHTDSFLKKPTQDHCRNGPFLYTPGSFTVIPLTDIMKTAHFELSSSPERELCLRVLLRSLWEEGIHRFICHQVSL
jgi:hypothetical protein